MLPITVGILLNGPWIAAPEDDCREACVGYLKFNRVSKTDCLLAETKFQIIVFVDDLLLPLVVCL